MGRSPESHCVCADLRISPVRGKVESMIPDIGVLIGGYVILRCVEILSRPETAFSSKVAKSVTSIFAMLTVVSTVVIIYDLVMSGSSLQSLPAMPR